MTSDRDDRKVMDRTRTGTASRDYDDLYYRSYVDGPYEVRSPALRSFFDEVAARLVAMFGPSTALDAGCAKGILVGSLSDRGVDAYGFDLSPTAIDDADPRAAGRLHVASLTEPLARSYDLVTCIEVIEHLSQPEAEVALDNLCAATDLIVLSSTPWDFREITHVNVRPAGHWAAMLHDRGFLRRFDADLGFISPWATAFERRPVRPRAVVHDYETALATSRTEAADTRRVLLDTQARLSSATAAADRFQGLEIDLLAARDAARGSEALAATATRQVDQVRGELDEARAVIAVMRASPSWRVGRILSAPFRAVRSLLRNLR